MIGLRRNKRGDMVLKMCIRDRIIFHEVIIDVHHVVEHDVAAGQRSDTLDVYKRQV